MRDAVFWHSEVAVSAVVWCDVWCGVVWCGVMWRWQSQIWLMLSSTRVSWCCSKTWSVCSPATMMPSSTFSVCSLCCTWLRAGLLPCEPGLVVHYSKWPHNHSAGNSWKLATPPHCCAPRSQMKLVFCELIAVALGSVWPQLKTHSSTFDMNSTAVSKKETTFIFMITSAKLDHFCSFSLLIIGAT